MTPPSGGTPLATLARRIDAALSPMWSGRSAALSEGSVALRVRRDIARKHAEHKPAGAGRAAHERYRRRTVGPRSVTSEAPTGLPQSR